MEAKIRNHHYLALTGDIRRSRDLEDRAGLQDRLETALARVNDVHADQLAVPLNVVQGDAFQGLLVDVSATIPLLLDLERDLHPATFRAGLGWGPLTTPLRQTTASMDGPAFHLAHDALESARNQDSWLVMRGLPPRLEPVIDGLAGILGAVRRNWSESRRRAVDARRRHQTAKAAASEIGVSPSAMSRALKAAHYGEVVVAERALAELIRLACEESP